MISVSEYEGSKEVERDMDQGMDVWQLIQQLEEQSRRDRQALLSLIEVYEQILAQF